MVAGTKRRKPVPKGLAAGERMKRIKLMDEETEHLQWRWIRFITKPSFITLEHILTSYGFLDTLRRPLCKNKWTKSKDSEKSAKNSAKESAPVQSECATDDPKNEEKENIIIVTSDDENQAVCDKKRCKENSNCLNYLGQARLEDEEASLKTYLEVSGLEDSPLEEVRDPDMPIGLKNLGATCYANAFIQVWFQDLAFRQGVYRCIPSQEQGESLEESPIFQLQVTFAALQESSQNVFNPIKLVESLKLRTFEQQDAQEFSKLFMNHLATEFDKQAVPSLKTLISDQFEGQQSYGTMCKKCKQKSERDSNFLELEVSLESNGNKLEDRIEALLQSEELTGDNKYYCAKCDSLQDAIRYTKLRRLPPVLHFSVLRFVFDVSTLERKKSKHAIVFPRLLNMSPFLDVQRSESVRTSPQQKPVNAVSTDDALYELRGVLLHKGASAYHGHYEAQVYDGTKKQFYQFNDEVVTAISTLQIHKPTTDERLPAVRKTYSRKRRRIDDSDNEEDGSPSKNGSTDYASSKDAYMLIYAHRDKEPTTAELPPRPQSPALKKVDELNRKHDEACNAYLNKKQELVNNFKLMRRQKQDIYRTWNIEDVKEESAVVSQKALDAWLSQGLEKAEATKDSGKNSSENNNVESQSAPSEPGHEPVKPVASDDEIRSVSSIDELDLFAPSKTSKIAASHTSKSSVLDNSSIQCPHGALDPTKAHEMKRIRLRALQDITKLGFTFQPEFTTKDVCYPCVLQIYNEKRYTINHTAYVNVFDELNETCDDSRGSWISKSWLRDWRQSRPKMHVPGEQDPHPESADFVEHVKCPHGQLTQSSALRSWINEEASSFLTSIFCEYEPVLTSADEMPNCPNCEVSAAISKENRQEMKQRVDKEKDVFKMLLASTILSKDPEPMPGVRQALISADFYRKWRAWIGRFHDRPRPETIDNSWLLCQHDKLLVDPSMSQDLGTSVLLIPLEDWKNFVEIYGGGPSITWFTPQASSSNADTSSDMDLDYTNYEVCQECRHKRLVDFDSAVISIRLWPEGMEREKGSKLVNGNVQKEPVASKEKDPFEKRPQPLRVSHRLRDSNRKVRIKDILVGKSMTVKEMKVEIQEAFNISPICQRLFMRGNELTDNTQTIKALGILANETLDLQEDKEAINLDSDVDVDSQGPPTKKRREEGRAFGGTVLSGDIKRSVKSDTTDASVDEKAASAKPSPPAETTEAVVADEKHCPMCTFINPPDVMHCTICESELI